MRCVSAIGQYFHFYGWTSRSKAIVESRAVSGIRIPEIPPRLRTTRSSVLCVTMGNLTEIQRECIIQGLLARSNGGKLPHGAKVQVARTWKCGKPAITKI
jgi:hypothetical protein